MRPSDHEASWDYFRRRRDEKRQMQVAPPPWEDDTVTAAPSLVRYDMDQSVHPYLATSDLDTRERITNAPTVHETRKIGQGAPLRPDCNVVRLAVMLRLVREKFRQHPDPAARLIATGDGRLIYGVDFSRYWAPINKDGTGWVASWGLCGQNYWKALTLDGSAMRHSNDLVAQLF